MLVGCPSRGLCGQVLSASVLGKERKCGSKVRRTTSALPQKPYHSRRGTASKASSIHSPGFLENRIQCRSSGQSHQGDHRRHKVFGGNIGVLKCYLQDSAGPPYSNELEWVRGPPSQGTENRQTMLTVGRHRQDSGAGPQVGSGTSTRTFLGHVDNLEPEWEWMGVGRPSPITDPLGWSTEGSSAG